MEYSIKRRFGAVSREDVIVSSEETKLLKIHFLIKSANVFRIQVLQRAKKFAHEIDHNSVIYQVYQFAYLITLSLFCFGQVVVKRHDEVFDQISHGELTLINLRVDLGAQLDQESDEAGEVEFV